MRGIIAGIVAIVVAQFLKVPIKATQTGKWDFKRMFGSGGMPSSHSAGVTALATHIGMKLGAKSLDFALAVIFGLIVMYDAQGVRKHAGETAIKVNELEEKIENLEGKPDIKVHDRREKRLKEMIGHQPEEVLGGAIIGFVIGLCSFIMSNQKRSRRIFR